MNSILYDTQEIFFLIYSPCWTVLLALVVAGGVVEAVRLIVTAIWKRRGEANDVPEEGGD